jgi:zinc transport system ATP-binding protein
MENEEVCLLTNVFIKYNNKTVLENINLSLKRSEFITIIGPNGTGKTTLLKTILGLVKPYSGTVKIFGYNPGSQPKGLIGYLPQSTFYNKQFPIKVLDVVVMGRYSLIGYFKLPSEKDREKAYNCLKELEIADYAEKNFQDLSGGLKQRVLIARALVSEPKLLLLDEPTTSLDVIIQKDFYETLDKLKREKGITILVVSHDIGVITQYVDKIICLNRKIHYYDKADKTIPLEVLEKVFGENVMFIVHDRNCLTCGINHDRNN